MMSGPIRDARLIAARDLHDCVTRDGIVAGIHHFTDLWARDSLFATFGLRTSGELQSARTTIGTFLRYQRGDGLIPYRVRRTGISISKYFGKPALLTSPQPDFRSYQSGGTVPDGGLMTVIATSEYVRRSGDKLFFKINGRQVRRAMHWYLKRFGDGLISEWLQCEWADAVLKIGKVLYTNLLYWKALGDIGDTTRQQMIGDKIRSQFWTGRYFADWVDWRRHDYFASHPNMLAIVFGLATKTETESIVAYAQQYCWNGWTLEENFPSYPWWRIPVQNYLVGMADYHNRGCVWLQPGILYAMGLHRLGKTKEAKIVLKAVADKVIEYNGIYEIYEKNGRPVNRLFYTAEHPFAWSAGLFLWATEQIVGR